MKRLILASASPRRKALLNQIGIDCEIIASNFKEAIDGHILPTELMERQKARAVARREKNAIIIAADTIVVYHNQMLGKPKDRHDAKRILTLLIFQ